MADPPCPILSSPMPRAAVPAPLTHHVPSGPRPRGTPRTRRGLWQRLRAGHTFLLLERLPGAGAGGSPAGRDLAPSPFPQPHAEPSPLCFLLWGQERVLCPKSPRVPPEVPPGWVWGTELPAAPGMECLVGHGSSSGNLGKIRSWAAPSRENIPAGCERPGKTLLWLRWFFSLLLKGGAA